MYPVELPKKLDNGEKSTTMGQVAEVGFSPKKLIALQQLIREEALSRRGVDAQMLEDLLSPEDHKRLKEWLVNDDISSLNISELSLQELAVRIVDNFQKDRSDHEPMLEQGA